jgi:hypothetical protein
MRIQDEAPHRFKYELTAAAAFRAAAVGLLRAPGKGAQPAPNSPGGAYRPKSTLYVVSWSLLLAVALS